MGASATDITVILTCHQQGRLLNPAARSVDAAIKQAKRERSLKVEWLIAAHEPSAATREYLEKNLPDGAGAQIVENTGSDSASERAVEQAQGRFVAIVNGHDLVSANWLSASFEQCEKRSDSVAYHPATVIVFGERNLLFVTPDQESPDFSVDMLFARNPWSMTCIASKEIFVKYPFTRVDSERGFAHADWHWICETVAGGVVHKPVAGTLSCCHQEHGHACIHSDRDHQLLLPSSKLFQGFGSQVEALV